MVILKSSAGIVLKGERGERLLILIWIRKKVNLPLNMLFSKNLSNMLDQKFWTGVWCGEDSLDNKFLHLVALDNNRLSSIADRVRKTDFGTEYSWNWRRPLKDGRETTELKELCRLCEAVQLNDCDVNCKWKLDNMGRYSVTSL